MISFYYKGENMNREQHYANGDVFAKKIYQGEHCDFEPMITRAFAIFILVDQWIENLDSNAESVNLRLKMGRLPQDEDSQFKVSDSQGYINSILAIKEEEEKKMLEFKSSNSVVQTQKLGVDISSAVEGLSKESAERLIQIGFDYAMRRYCIKFHLSKEYQDYFGKCEILFDEAQYKNLNKLLTFKGREDDFGAGRKLGLIQLERFIFNEANKGFKQSNYGKNSYAKAMMAGLTQIYLFGHSRFILNAQKIDQEVKDGLVSLNATTDGFIADELSPYSNPFIVMFDKVIEKESGFSFFDEAKKRLLCKEKHVAPPTIEASEAILKSRLLTKIDKDKIPGMSDFPNP